MAYSTTSIAWGTLYYLFLPVFWLSKVTFTVITAIVSPVLHLTRFILYLALLPFRILIILEPLYIYFGVALIIGAIFGFLLHTIIKFIGTLVGLDEQPQPEGMTIATYRAKRAEKQAKKVEQETREEGIKAPLRVISTVAQPDLRRRTHRGLASPAGLMSTTIFEEEDSSDDEFI